MKKMLEKMMAVVAAGCMLFAANAAVLAEETVPVEAPRAEVSAPVEVPHAEAAAPAEAAPEAAVEQASALPTVKAALEPTVEATLEPVVEATAAPAVEATLESTVEATAEPEITAEPEGTVAPTAEAVPDDAKLVAVIQDKLNADRSVSVYLAYDGDYVTFGDRVTFYAVLNGYEDTVYTLQWQSSHDNRTWSDISGADKATYAMNVTEENYTDYYRVAVTINGVVVADELLGGE